MVIELNDNSHKEVRLWVIMTEKSVVGERLYHVFIKRRFAKKEQTH